MKKPTRKENEYLDNLKVKGVLFVNRETGEITYSTVLNPHLLTETTKQKCKCDALVIDTINDFIACAKCGKEIKHIKKIR